MLDREEHIEQAHFFRTLGERLKENLPMQELLVQAKHEALATAKLPMAIDFLLTELKHAGVISTAMQRLSHYFTPFQTFIVGEAEHERGRFDMRIGVDVLRAEAEYLSGEPTPQGLFMYQFETISRNRLRYDYGLTAMAGDPMYDQAWRDWIMIVRRQIGIVELPDMVYVRSIYFQKRRERKGEPTNEPEAPVLFGEREGQIAWANRKKDPSLFFAALQRHLSYPRPPRVQPPDPAKDLLPQMMRRMERLEARVKLLEEENREGAFDITKFYEKPDGPGVPLE